MHTKGNDPRQQRFDRRLALRACGALAGTAALARFARPTLAHDTRSTTMTYQIEGSLLEVCTCGILCPCWVGEDPDNGTCDSVFGWHVEKGTIEGIDVGGITLALSVHIPGNVLAGDWTAAVFVDEKATQAQEEALLNVFTGKLGGPIADLAALIGTVVSVERMPITFDVHEGEGTLKVGTEVECVLSPFIGATGEPTALHDSIFTTIPGSPAIVGKATLFRRDASRHGLMDVNIKDHNAIQGQFRFEG